MTSLRVCTRVEVEELKSESVSDVAIGNDSTVACEWGRGNDDARVSDKGFGNVCAGASESVVGNDEKCVSDWHSWKRRSGCEQLKPWRRVAACEREVKW